MVVVADLSWDTVTVPSTLALPPQMSSLCLSGAKCVPAMAQSLWSLHCILWVMVKVSLTLFIESNL